MVAAGLDVEDASVSVVVVVDGSVVEDVVRDVDVGAGIVAVLVEVVGSGTSASGADSSLLEQADVRTAKLSNRAGMRDTRLHRRKQPKIQPTAAFLESIRRALER